ncbi:integrase [Streptomyces phage Nesbitt]|uniref:Integrase n=2 Tax=Abbeymikolonvirus abbeymikolon TaxID=2734213 RepID=A0A2P1JT86_9CAUD|nr:integrase [Streptomyces phage AbbeyMikolon]AUG87127.1 integrase [Streptomyces phage AbbeyMikolon]AVO22312.1 integrase [Streptomyces phage Nesbitt]
MDTHAGVYARQSKRRANKSEISTADQLKEGVARARSMGATQIATYEDLGISAYSGDERPDFERLVADCRAGRINVLIVYYISRLSRREVADVLPLLQELLTRGVTLVSITEGVFKRDNIMDLIHLIFRLDAAHQESKNKSLAVKNAKDRARALGGHVGSAPFGFETYEVIVQTKGEDGRSRPVAIRRLRPNKEDCKIAVEHIFTPVLKYMDLPFDPTRSEFHPGSVSGVTTAMNQKAIPTRGKKLGKARATAQWERKTIRRILMDPRFIGYEADTIYNSAGTRKISSYRIRRDENGNPVRTSWEPIVDPADWWRIQEWLAGRQAAKGNNRGGSLLSGDGLAWCPCGSTFGQHSFPPVKERNRDRTRVYRCTKGQRQSDVHTGAVMVSMANLDNYVVNRIFSLIGAAEGDEDTLLILLEAQRRYGRLRENPETAGERDRILTERAEVRQGLEDLYDERDAGGFRTDIGRRRFLKSEAALGERLEGLDRRLAELEEAHAPKLPLAMWEAEGRDPMREGGWWSTRSLEDQREFVRLFVKRVTVRPLKRRGVAEPMHERVKIEWHRPTEEVDLVA